MLDCRPKVLMAFTELYFDMIGGVTTQAIHFPTRNALFLPPKGEGIARFAGNTDLGLSSYLVGAFAKSDEFCDGRRHVLVGFEGFTNDIPFGGQSALLSEQTTRT